jgi:O-methyltransferase
MAATAETMPPGNFCEVGVYKGGSAEYLHEIAVRQGRTLYLYDTFTGIPERSNIDDHRIGDFGDGDLEATRRACPTATILVGIFPGTIVPMGELAFCHIDCDQYESIKACCQLLGPMMVPGSMMWFDDPLQLDGATAAVNECFGDRWERLHEKVVMRF